MRWQDDGDMGEEVEDDASLYDSKCQWKDYFQRELSASHFKQESGKENPTLAGKLHGVPLPSGLFFCRGRYQREVYSFW